MKARITIEGKLIIEAENQLEGYAFSRWFKENFKDRDDGIVMSDFPLGFDYIGPVQYCENE